MDKSYNHKSSEEKIYSLWETQKAFTPKKEKGKKPFCIIMPPPNANNPLHIGHAREVSIQDILVRYHRMKGEPTLWLPGADHAGIETQYVFEKHLKQKGKSRFDYSREDLYQLIWDYVQKNKQIMESQLKRLGASCDWSRKKFTLDPDIVKVVLKTFKKLYNDGLVYRGERIVNYCPNCGTAYSQLEIDSVEKEGKLYYINYGIITIATTRPETIFADAAIAVNPKDQRYKHLIGKKALIPLINREIPIIEDSLVDKSFGTGALKVTPAHDPTDFIIGRKHALPKISVIDENGKMTATPEKYIGLKINKAREEIVNDLKNSNKIVKTEDIKHFVSTCYRCKNEIEPTVSKQWFLKVEPLVKLALEAIKEKKVKFIAKKYEKIAIHWYKNLEDWNISRQIVWGIRIPAWRCEKCLEWAVTDGAKPETCPKCKNSKLTQDKDTFDTWFSSAQWPFATLEVTQKGDFEYFYPTSVMDPSYDILPFWVIRMIMLGLYITDKTPFKDVLLHGLVRDKEGIKISKSKGNVIDPIEMVDKYGADALRMASVWGVLIENDNILSEENIKAQRNFANKLWNISRYVQTDSKEKNTLAKPRPKNKSDQKILKDLKITTKNVTRNLEKYRLNEAAKDIYDFTWNTFANTYLESTKNRKKEAQKTLRFVLQQTLKLAHPFMPFVTEEIWQVCFSSSKNNLLINELWPN